jgi:hypothetical protein
MPLAARKRFQVLAIERTFCDPAPKGVQLVNKDDGVLAFHQFLHDFQAFFELSAIFCPRNDQERSSERFVYQRGTAASPSKSLR